MGEIFSSKSLHILTHLCLHLSEGPFWCAKPRWDRNGSHGRRRVNSFCVKNGGEKCRAPNNLWVESKSTLRKKKTYISYHIISYHIISITSCFKQQKQHGEKT